MSAPVGSPLRAAAGLSPFPRLVRVELRKALDTVAVPALLLAVLGLGVAAVVFKAVLPGPEVTAYREIGVAMIPAPLMAVLGVVASAAEWSDRSVSVSFLLEPRRGRVLASRAVVALLLGLGVAVVLVGSALLTTALAGTGPDPWADPVPAVGRGFGFVLVPVLSGIAIGSLFRNLVVGALAAIVVPSTVPSLAGRLFGEGVVPWTDLSSAARVVEPGRVGPAATAALLWIVVPLALGAYRWFRRDVT